MPVRQMRAPCQAMGRLLRGGAEVCGEGEEGAGEGLGEAVAGDEGAVIDPAVTDDLGLARGEDDVAAAEDEAPTR